MQARVSGALRYGVHQAFAIVRSHFDDIDFGLLAQVFFSGFNEDEMDAMEEEAPAQLAQALEQNDIPEGDA